MEQFDSYVGFWEKSNFFSSIGSQKGAEISILEGLIFFSHLIEHSKLMLDAIRKITSAPVKYVFYSHNHYDHVTGGEVFKADGATIISHVDAFDFLKENPRDGVLLPDNNWIGRKMR